MEAVPLLARLVRHPLSPAPTDDWMRSTELRSRIIREKGLLRRIYEHWYALIVVSVPPGAGHVVEIGSGGGFLSHHLSELVRTEVFFCGGIDAVADAQRLPFNQGSLRGLVMTDVLHHIPDVSLFFQEATRCVRPGGTVVMIEPWVTRWSRFVYSRLHHEPFDPAAQSWTVPVHGPLAGANSALPWILFERDRALFECRFPSLRVALVQPLMPLVYLLSGGVAFRGFVPGCFFGAVRSVERLLPWERTAAMFAKIVLTRA